jgi:hypothetical protein
MDGAFIVNPQIGVLNGALLSGSNRAQAFEGVVPTLTINHNAKYTEGQLYFGYYLATSAPRTNDFVHWWINGGFKPFADRCDWLKIMSFGAHFEQLYQTRNANGPTSTIYSWVGPYTQFTLPNNVFIRFTAGRDIQGDVSGTFYKLALGFSF